MKAYVIGDIVVHDKDRYLKYVAVAPDFVRKHGGTYLARGGDITVVEGEWDPARIVVLEFPSKEAALALFADPDYQAVAVDRQQATTGNFIVVEGASV